MSLKNIRHFTRYPYCTTDGLVRPFTRWWHHAGGLSSSL